MSTGGRRREAEKSRLIIERIDGIDHLTFNARLAKPSIGKSVRDARPEELPSIVWRTRIGCSQNRSGRFFGFRAFECLSGDKLGDLNRL
jgi:hypothetical protein